MKLDRLLDRLTRTNTTVLSFMIYGALLLFVYGLTGDTSYNALRWIAAMLIAVLPFVFVGLFAAYRVGVMHGKLESKGMITGLDAGYTTGTKQRTTTRGAQASMPADTRRSAVVVPHSAATDETADLK